MAKNRDEVFNCNKCNGTLFIQKIASLKPEEIIARARCIECDRGHKLSYKPKKSIDFEANKPFFQ